MRREKLEGNSALKLLVMGLIYNTHSAFTKFFENFIMGNRFTDHEAGLS